MHTQHWIETTSRRIESRFTQGLSCGAIFSDVYVSFSLNRLWERPVTLLGRTWRPIYAIQFWVGIKVRVWVVCFGKSLTSFDGGVCDWMGNKSSELDDYFLKVVSDAWCFNFRFVYKSVGTYKRDSCGWHELQTHLHTRKIDCTLYF